jgi:hypothetical protein
MPLVMLKCFGRRQIFFCCCVVVSVSTALPNAKGVCFSNECHLQNPMFRKVRRNCGQNGQ